MLEKPTIQEPSIEECLKEQYGLEKSTVEFLPIGNDVNSAVYRVLANDNTLLYLKLRRGDFNKASVIVPHLLRESGVKQVIAPLLTKEQQEWAKLNEFSLALYPYIDGKNGFQHPLSDVQWIELGTAEKGLHALQPPADLADSISQEDYSSIYNDEVKKIMRQIHGENFVDSVAAQFAEFMKENGETLNHIVKRSEELNVELKKQKQEFVLCHADLHGANILIDKSNQLYIVDWDTLIFAQKERDLMFIGGGIGGAWNKKEEVELFYEGYGRTEINHTALTYYRYERFAQDIVEFSKRLLLTREGGKDRKRSLEKFMNAFAPNNVVEIALREDSL
jgi:spectinomycin phosphotransferase